MKVAVFGLGYVGTITAAGLAASGHDVVGVDVDDVKVDAISAGHSPVVEPGVDEMIRSTVAAGRLHATTNVDVGMESADVSLLCVGTPSTARGDTDLTYIRRAVSDIHEAMGRVSPPESGFHSVVIRSTVPPGTGSSVVAAEFADPADGWSVGTAMCPEFLREGSGKEDFFAPPFVVVGTANRCTERQLDELFGFIDVGVHHVTVETAEALKYACNAFHAAKVSFANELARVFRSYGVDTREVMQIFCEDDKLNIAPTYLRPGFAFGGSCLPKDLRALQHMARSIGVDIPLLAGTTLTNELVVRDVVDRLIAGSARRIAVLGLSFKMNTDDLRESPNVELVERLIGKGFEVRVFDPIINPDRLIGANRRYVESKLPHLNKLLSHSPVEALQGAESAVVSSSDPAILEALTSSAPPVVMDLNGRLGAQVEALAGYEGCAW